MLLQTLLALAVPVGAENGWIPPNELVSWIGPAEVAVSLRLINRGLTAEERPQSWDGAHLALRYQGDCRSYYVSLNRRDGTMVIKKKTPDDKLGCVYTNLGDYFVFPVPYDRPQDFRVFLRDGPDGSVSIKVYESGRLVASGLDKGEGGPPIREPGEIVLRSDNAELEYAGLKIEAP